MFRLAKKPLPGLALLTLIPALLILSFFAFAHSTGKTRSEVNLNADLGHDTSLQTVAQNTLGAREGAIVRRVRTQLRIDDDERSILLEGMCGAVSFGTAKTANLDSLPVYIVGKTGTSTQVSGYRTQGWFTGIAFKPSTAPEPANAELLVVVYLKSAHGSEAAELARPIFEEFAGKRSIGVDRNLYFQL